jgi:membrane protein required for colicin V production
MTFTPPDILILLILAFFTINGFRHGFIDEAGRILAMICGFMGAQRYHHDLMPYLELYFTNPNVLKIVSYLAVFFVVVVIINIIVIVLRKFFELILLGWLNRLLGSLLGLIKGILVVSLIILVMQIIPAEIREKLEQDSVMYQICDNVKDRLIKSIHLEDEVDEIKEKVYEFSDEKNIQKIQKKLNNP